MLAPVLGEPEMTAPECGGGSDTAAEFVGGLTVYFGGGQLSGWLLDGAAGPAPMPVLTDRGLRAGDTVADLTETYPDDFRWVDGSSLGDEFFIGTGFPYLGGLATGTAQDDTVQMLWAGDSCIAR
jgi:hypothetical protein